jgi:hypothetical protein
MPTQTNQLQWLNTRYAAILEELQGTETGETTEKILELLSLNQQIQTQIMLHLLAEQKTLEMDTEEMMMEISQYLHEVVTSRIREAENLEKVR